MMRPMDTVFTRSVHTYAAAATLVVAAAVGVARVQLEAQPRGKAVYDHYS